MLLYQCMKSISCDFYSDIPIRSHAIVKIGTFGIPILTSSAQLDQDIWVASGALIHVL